MVSFVFQGTTTVELRFVHWAVNGLRLSDDKVLGSATRLLLSLGDPLYRHSEST